MKIICAGLSKTGTKSMNSALRYLGYSVHDFEDHFSIHLDEYLQVVDGKAMPVTSMYADVDAVTDIPSCAYWELIYEAYSDSKVVLMVRDDEEVWVLSLLKTLKVWNTAMSKAWIVLGLLLTPTGRKFNRLVTHIFMNTFKLTPELGDDMKKKQSTLKEVYRKHNARVKEVIPRDKLLVFNLKHGWEPLCEFLGVEVPDIPFPRQNVNGEYPASFMNRAVIGQKIFKELVFIFSCLAIVLAVLCVVLL